MQLPRISRDIALLLGRVALGIVFIAHGWQKLSTNGIDATATSFEQQDVILPTASAWFSALVEFAGGIALLAGALTPVVGLLLTIDMIGAYLFVHAGNGIWVQNGGYELVLALGTFSFVMAALGAGRFSVDAMASRMTHERTAETSRSRRGRPILGH